MVRFWIYISLILYSTLATFAQSSSHKTYSGPFSNGEATYTYIEASDGTRIFDGKFSYRQGKCTLVGQFKNDLQSGTWTLTDNSENYFVKTWAKATVSFTFGDNGLLSGTVSEKAYFKNGTVIETASYSLDEGMLEGEYKYVDWHNRKTTVSGNYHQNQPIGIWRYTYADREPVSVNYENTEFGKPEVITIDPSTGDRIISFSDEYTIGKNFDDYPRYGSLLSPYNRKQICEVGILYRKSDYVIAEIEAKRTSFWYNGIYYDLSNIIRNHTTLNSDTYVSDATVKLRLIIEKDGTISSTRILSGYNGTVDADVTQLVSYFGLPPLSRSNRFGKDETVRTIVRMELHYPFIDKELMKKEVKRDETDGPIVFFDFPDKNAEFPGGEAALYKYILNEMRYPVAASENGIQGVVLVKFEVLSDGTVGKVEILRGRDSSLVKEALRIIKSLPRFTPAEVDGKAVATHCVLPVTFRLN